MSRKKRKVNATGRNKNSRYVGLDCALLGSDAYRSLSTGARALLIEFGRLFYGDNNGELFMSQRKAAEMVGVSNHVTASRYLRELEEKGFIRARIKGSFDNKTRLATVWVLTHFSYNGQPPTRDFTRWRAPPEQKQRAQKSTVTGPKSAPIDLSEWPDGCEIAA
jgi:hypothetical protein